MAPVEFRSPSGQRPANRCGPIECASGRARACVRVCLFQTVCVCVRASVRACVCVGRRACRRRIAGRPERQIGRAGGDFEYFQSAVSRLLPAGRRSALENRSRRLIGLSLERQRERERYYYSRHDHHHDGGAGAGSKSSGASCKCQNIRAFGVRQTRAAPAPSLICLTE